MLVIGDYDRIEGKKSSIAIRAGTKESKNLSLLVLEFIRKRLLLENQSKTTIATHSRKGTSMLSNTTYQIYDDRFRVGALDTTYSIFRLSRLVQSPKLPIYLVEE